MAGTPKEKKLFQYEDPARSPFVVTMQTHKVIRLLAGNSIPDFTHGIDYVQNYTFPYLETAINNSQLIFDKDGVMQEKVDPKSREAAAHAFVIFAWMPDLTSAPNVSALKDGFSRRGMLRAPQNRKEYITKIREMQMELSAFLNREGPFSKNGYLRTIVFFRIGAFLAPDTKLTPRERKIRERENEILSKILKDVDIHSLD